MRSDGRGNAQPLERCTKPDDVPAELEQHGAAAEPAKTRKPPKRQPRPKRHKARARKSAPARARKKPKPSPAIPKFPNSPPAGEPIAEQAAEPAKDGEPKHKEEPAKDGEKTKRAVEEETKDGEKTKRAVEEETCRGHAYAEWAKQIIAKHPDAVRENLGSAWPPPNPKLHEALAKAPDEVVQLAEIEAEKRGCSLKAADFRYTGPPALWRYLKGYYHRNRPQTSPGQFEAWVEETVERFQGEFLRQEQFRKMDDLDDQEAQIEHDLDRALDKAVEKAAKKFNLAPDVIWDALTEGFRNHPKLAEIVDDVPGKIIFEAGEEFRVTAEPYSVWARFGARPGQPPGRIVFTWGRIFKTALEPLRHSTDLDDKCPSHHFRLLKEQGSRVIEREVVIPGKLVVKGSTYLPAIRAVRDLGARVYMRAGMKEEYGAKILRFLDWERTRVVGKRLPRVGWWKTNADRDFLLRPDRAILPSSACVLVPGEHEHEHEPEIVYELETKIPIKQYGLLLKGAAEGWRRGAADHAKDSNIVFGVGVLLAALLLKWSGQPARIYNIWGFRKIGKSALFQIVQSFVGKPYRPGAGAGTFGFGLNATPNKVIERALLRSDFGLPLDEHGMLAPKDFAKLVYMLVAGEEKGRWHQAEQSFNALVLMNGEKSFSQLMSDAGLQVNPGQLVRVLDIPAEVRRGVAFETVPRDQLDEKSKQIYDWTMEDYGHPGLEWQQHLVDLQSGRITDEVGREMERWRALAEVKRAIAQVPSDYGSVIGGFALPAAALEMGRQAKVLPTTWTRETNDAAVFACMERWADALITAERQLREKIVAALREGLFTYIRKTAGELVGARAEDAADLTGDWQGMIDDGERYGFVKIDDKHPRICIDLAAFEDLCGGRMQALELAKRFLERGWLERDAPRLTKNEMIAKGRTLRCYVLRAAFLLDDEALLAPEREAA